MNLEEFLGKRLTKEQMEGLNANSKIERIEKDKEDNKLTITLPNELVGMINSDDRGKKILKNNIVKLVRELKKGLEFQKDIASIDTISYI
ncbi:hypothetical protein [Clostridium sp.]|uniref:hypothetical protein n=1 Tax=Clostridium sp. TaxID=1506 RepID=UPI001DAD0EB8|nr:hypothetical protein [Clostridium sp.]MBS5985247.1 hypothetical protein [Clostridium sp.]